MNDSGNSLFDIKLEVSESLNEKIAPHINMRNFLLLFAILFFLVAWNRGIALIYALSALMFSVLLVSYLAPYLSLRGVSAAREKHLKAAVGETLHVSLQLSNSGRNWCRMLEVVDQVPCAAQDSQQPMIYVPKLKKNTRATYHVEMNWRGLHTLGPLQLRSSYPLGVNQVRRTVEGSDASVLVYPSPFNIEKIEFRRASVQYTEGNFLSQRRGGHDEFSALREYRSGDSLRHIHWGKSSQGRDFQVKEYDSLESSVVTIVLDRSASANLGEGRHTTFEFQVSIAASVARFCIDRGIPVAVIGDRASRVRHDSSEAQYRNIIEYLALVQADRDHKETLSYAGYVQALMTEHAQGCWVLFSNDDNNELQTLNYHPSISQTLVMEFDSRSFLHPLSTPARTSATGLGDYLISRNDNLETVFS